MDTLAQALHKGGYAFGTEQKKNQKQNDDELPSAHTEKQRNYCNYIHVTGLEKVRNISGTGC